MSLGARYPAPRPQQGGPQMPDRPNIVLIMTDQQRADLCAREGYPLDTTPFLDALAAQGTWFNRAYTVAPVCVPARVSTLTGRYPSATRVRTNHNVEDATYQADLIDVLARAGLCHGPGGQEPLAPDARARRPLASSGPLGRAGPAGAHGPGRSV